MLTWCLMYCVLVGGGCYSLIVEIDDTYVECCRSGCLYVSIPGPCRRTLGPCLRSMSRYSDKILCICYIRSLTAI